MKGLYYLGLAGDVRDLPRRLVEQLGPAVVERVAADVAESVVQPPGGGAGDLARDDPEWRGERGTQPTPTRHGHARHGRAENAAREEDDEPARARGGGAAMSNALVVLPEPARPMGGAGGGQKRVGRAMVAIVIGSVVGGIVGVAAGSILLGGLVGGAITAAVSIGGSVALPGPPEP